MNIEYNKNVLNLYNKDMEPIKKAFSITLDADDIHKLLSNKTGSPYKLMDIDGLTEIAVYYKEEQYGS